MEERHLGKRSERLGTRVLLSLAHAVLALLSQTAEFTHARKRKKKKAGHKKGLCPLPAPVPPPPPLCLPLRLLPSTQPPPPPPPPLPLSPRPCVERLKLAFCPAVPLSNIHPNPVFQPVVAGAVPPPFSHCLPLFFKHPFESQWKSRERFSPASTDSQLTFST